MVRRVFGLACNCIRSLFCYSKKLAGFGQGAGTQAGEKRGTRGAPGSGERNCDRGIDPKYSGHDKTCHDNRKLATALTANKCAGDRLRLALDEVILRAPGGR